MEKQTVKSIIRKLPLARAVEGRGRGGATIHVWRTGTKVTYLRYIADDPTRERAADFFPTRSSSLMAGGRKRSVYENGIIASRRQGKIVRIRRLMSRSFHRGGLYNYETFMVSRSRARQPLTALCVTRSPAPSLLPTESLHTQRSILCLQHIFMCVYISI